MLPWAHVAIGYLLWSVATHSLRGRPPNDREVWVLLFGTQLPDLIDKPLAWSFGVLPSGRSLGHSLLFVAAVFALASVVAKRRNARALAVAYGVGHLSHSLADAYRPLMEGRYGDVGYLLWPLLEGPADGPGRSIVEHFRGLTLSSFLGYQSAVTALLLALWLYDGTPGLPLRWTADGDGPRRNHDG